MGKRLAHPCKSRPEALASGSGRGVHVMLALAQVSSMNTRRTGFNRRAARLQALAPEGDIRPVLFGRAQGFFDRHALMLEKMQNSMIASSRGQLLVVSPDPKRTRGTRPSRC
jgi:hypothetical protein